ncbi:lathosterol oxidase [Amyelois transitella]|uniref:lathosterol oxidase n=1 Tax=Amyelois transitella TaxID=680683 RepID=UPI00067D6546|nr:lathosterol oxidase [Amyelois transitella]
MTSQIHQRRKDKGKTDDVTPPKYFDPLIEGVKWIERYSGPLDKFFEKLPESISTFVATLAVFTFGSVLRGEWVVILVTALKQATGHTQTGRNTSSEDIYQLFTLEKLKMENFFTVFIGAHLVSYIIYFSIGGFLHYYYYVNKRHLAHEWKIQPNKWLPPDLERHEIMMSVIALFVTGTFSAFLATYIFNGNPSTVYYQFDEFGWWWFFLQFPVIFIYMDYVTYILHRMYHTPFLYKHFHKLHHKYKQPTAFSVAAIHPVEILHIQMTLSLPLFTIPVHWFAFYAIAIYNYTHGILDHSGVNFKAQWWQPWQPDAEFHDKHHEFFHCNFGFNMTLWDKLHGTVRKQHHLYTENTYHGEAKPLDSNEAQALVESDPELQDLVKNIEKYDGK